MRGPSSPAAARAVHLFDEAPRGDRFHVRARWWSCPIPAIDSRLPSTGRVLEVGCGHGLLSLYLALREPARHVTGIDIDAHKIALAQQAAARLAPGEAQVSFAAVVPGELPAGPFDAIVFNDVLYLMHDDMRRSVLEDCYQRLAPGGVLLVKEIDVKPRWKYEINHAQELLATKVLRYTAGDQVEVVAMKYFVDLLESCGAAVTLEPIDRGYPHAHAVVVARRPAADLTT